MSLHSFLVAVTSHETGDEAGRGAISGEAGLGEKEGKAEPGERIGEARLGEEGETRLGETKMGEKDGLAGLVEARLYGAGLGKAKLSGAGLGDARLSGARLGEEGKARRGRAGGGGCGRCHAEGAVGRPRKLVILDNDGHSNMAGPQKNGRGG